MNKLKSIREELEVLQICDSTFPIGSFNHSYGFETYLRNKQVVDNESFERWLITFLQTQFLYGEGLVIRLVYEALENKKESMVWEYDQILTLSMAAKETREGSKMVAKQMGKLILELHDVPRLEKYQEKIREKTCFGNPAIVFALFAYQKNLDVETAIMDYAYSVLSTMIQNAVRAIPLGQVSGQKILQTALYELEEICPMILQIDGHLLGANMPGMEIAQMNHEIQDFRLFMS